MPVFSTQVAQNAPTKTFANSPEGFVDFGQWMVASGVQKETCLLCMEATGVYGWDLARWLQEQGWHVAVVNPARIEGYSRAMALRTKNDSIDAYCIAHFALAQSPATWSPPSHEMNELRQLLVRREQLNLQMSQQVNAAEHTRSDQVQASIQRLREAIENELETINIAIQAILNQAAPATESQPT